MVVEADILTDARWSWEGARRDTHYSVIDLSVCFQPFENDPLPHKTDDTRADVLCLQKNATPELVYNSPRGLGA